MRFAFVFVLLASMLAACHRPPDEARIRETIEAMRSAAEARKPDGVLDPIAGDFTGNGGEIDRKGLERLLQLQLLRRDAVSASLGAIEVSIDGDRAVAKFDVHLAGDAGWLPGRGETYSFVTGWRRQGRDWVCYNATWKGE